LINAWRVAATGDSVDSLTRQYLGEFANLPGDLLNNGAES
jgi:hypothetical protein